MIPGLRAPSGSLLARAGQAAALAGVTRLAELTGLDRIGMPVWQTVRPLSRSLSVHQGKGLDDDAARIGALLEALDTHLAEAFDADGPVCAWHALPIGARPTHPADFAAERGDFLNLDEPVRWAEADTLSGAKLHVPFACVSLDSTNDLPSIWDRSSNGLASGTSLSDALMRAACEVVERDAVSEWRSADAVVRTHDRLERDAVPFAWFKDLAEAARSVGVALTCYRVPALAGLPVLVCEAADHGKQGGTYRAVWGSGCHPVAEIALLRAVSEALQSRVTLIAGAREDVPPSAYRAAPEAVIGFGLPAPTGRRGLAWQMLADGPDTLDGIEEGLVRGGADPLAWVTLGETFGFVTVKAFVPGLAGLERRRRRAA